MFLVERFGMDENFLDVIEFVILRLQNNINEIKGFLGVVYNMNLDESEMKVNLCIRIWVFLVRQFILRYRMLGGGKLFIVELIYSINLI